jgi:4-hydroxybenzoate polyprenyltransferase
MSRARALVQLMRLPALPTALADIGLGLLAAGPPDRVRWLGGVLAAAASACLYTGGMVFNDFFDVEQDRRERPLRPLPSGRVSRRAAGTLGVLLLAGGLLAAAVASAVLARDAGVPKPHAPLAVAAILVVAILLYDAWLKRTPVGPLGMGTCRFLNVLLGVTGGGGLVGPEALLLAAVVGLYIVGVTWFARTEALLSRQSALAGAAAVMLAALALGLLLPAVRAPARQSSPLFVYVLVALGLVVGDSVCRAIASPASGRVQAAVRRALAGLIVLDTALAIGLAGNAGLWLLLLMVPAYYLGRVRWLYAT